MLGGKLSFSCAFGPNLVLAWASIFSMSFIQMLPLVEETIVDEQRQVSPTGKSLPGRSQVQPTTQGTTDKMAKRRRRKISIKNSSLFAFFALLSLFMLEENSAYQHQVPYRYNNNQQQQQKQTVSQQKHRYIMNQAQAFSADGGLSSGSSDSSSDELRSAQLRSSQLTLQNFQQEQSAQNFEQQLSSNQNYQTSGEQQQHPFHHSRQQHEWVGSVLPTAHLCSKLEPQVGKQLKMCKLISHSPAADDVVSLGASKGLAECRAQFKNDRWNCTHTSGDHQLLTSELTQSIGNPESGFIHAIAAAGIVHSIASACSRGNLADCACDKSRIGTINVRQTEQPIHWKWGGCSNNIRHGMVFAKHLVELLDAVHQQKLQQQQQQHHHQNHRQHHLSRRSTIMLRDRWSNQRPPEAMPQVLGDQQLSSSPAAAAAQRDFCQQNQNISQAKHHELIKSLLSRNSLEKHQEFRLAMNMHNNKIGRMAVVKNMDLHCRCHGLSGSCSLKTCWLGLPDFQVIGEYLKRKYKSSVHLPTKVNLNKLIPMMDRQEISAILSSQESSAVGYSSPVSEPPSPSSSTPTEFALQRQQLPEYAALVHNDADSQHEQVDAVAATVPSPMSSITTTLAPTVDLNLKLNQTATSEGPSEQHRQASHKTTTTTPVEIPKDLKPLSQQEYQDLLRDMKLCNTKQAGSHLQTRDLNHHHHQQLTRKQQQQQHQKHQQQLLNGAQTKQANQQLSHLLATNDKDELIHLHKSPEYCDADLRHGFMGIQMRICSDNQTAPDSCDRLCCGRRYRRITLNTERICHCSFKFCCTVSCSTCKEEREVNVCD